MKKKHLNKKLALKKQTIATLGESMMEKMKGGATWTLIPECTEACQTAQTYCAPCTVTCPTDEYSIACPTEYGICPNPTRTCICA